jgi:hypothetical protein
MNLRDKAILNHVSEFRVLDRNQIIKLHFNNVKDSVSSCNKVLKRLVRDKFLTFDPTRKPYNYFPNPTTIKKDSGKLFHYKAIADFIIESAIKGKLKEFMVERKLGEKGTVEPDVFMIWNKTPFFVEVQRSNQYSKKYMEKKLKRYEDYFYSDEWKNLQWQPKDKPPRFPYIWIVSDTPYKLEPQQFKVYQTKTVDEFIDKYIPKKQG